MKRLVFAVLAVAVLMLPVAAVAAPARDGSLRASLAQSRGVPGTDVSAPDQQSPVSASNPAPVVVSSPATSGFDWGDAGIGAAISVALLLALAGAAGVRRRHSHPIALG
jgi:uncharacterized protein (TIGR03382 family)